MFFIEFFLIRFYYLNSEIKILFLEYWNKFGKIVKKLIRCNYYLYRGLFFDYRFEVIIFLNLFNFKNLII